MTSSTLPQQSFTISWAKSPPKQTLHHLVSLWVVLFSIGPHFIHWVPDPHHFPTRAVTCMILIFEQILQSPEQCSFNLFFFHVSSPFTLIVIMKIGKYLALVSWNLSCNQIGRYVGGQGPWLSSHKHMLQRRDVNLLILKPKSQDYLPFTWQNASGLSEVSWTFQRKAYTSRHWLTSEPSTIAERECSFLRWQHAETKKRVLIL